MKITKTTPILCVANIEESLPFWIAALGYEKVVEAPHEGSLGFVILRKDGSEVMLQTHACLACDLPEVAKRVNVGSMFLYSDVDSLDSALEALKDVALLVPPRKTAYGAKEIFTCDRDGNVLGFAEHVSQ